MVSCGDDCKIKFWDTRKIEEPLMVVSEHSHWYVRALQKYSTQMFYASIAQWYQSAELTFLSAFSEG